MAEEFNETYYQAEVMKTVERTFIDAYSFICDNMIPGETKNHVLQYVGNLLLRERVYLMVTPSGVARAIKGVFGDDAIRNFVLDLSFNFFARWGGVDDNHIGLARSLAAGCGLTVGASGEANAIPKEIDNVLAKEGDAFLALRDNKWMITLVLIKLFIRFDHEEINAKLAPRDTRTITSQS